MDSEGTAGLGYRLLVVEDEPEHQLLIRRALAQDARGFMLVHFARDSGEALQCARQMTYDALLVDNRIPGTRGLDLLTELRDSGIEAPFVLMTSAGSEDLVVEAMRQRVAEYVIKDSGFWRELPQRLHRVIDSDRQKRREAELVSRLERTNARLDAMRAKLVERSEELSARLTDASLFLEGREHLDLADLNRLRAMLAAMGTLVGG